MAYTAITPQAFRQKKGTLAEKISAEFVLVDTELASLEARIATLESA